MYVYNLLTEKDMLNDLIYSEKYISNSYSSIVLELPCPELRKILFRCQLNVQSIESNIENARNERGWNLNSLCKLSSYS
ncbi:coat F domain [Gottschalkia purinilytica]|uniref:Coat F domain n=1 Tax=Gottschalkia purinilytica TaxID=1503 RepID=A0A0L0WDM7_GOTPU|nr:spore coat protein [Gottschalkia purinilytica]KNF09583.1 coat F domain [Gottschalkia purinilytica]